VDATTTAVKSAMGEVSGLLTSEYLGVDVLDGNLSESWPMVMVSYITTRANFNSSDCTFTEGLLEFFAWAQLNQYAIDTASAMGYSPLSFGYKTYVFFSWNSAVFYVLRIRFFPRKLIDNLGKIMCNGERAFQLSWLIGEGLNFNLYTAWVDNFVNTNTRLRYFQGATNYAIQDMAQCSSPATHSSLTTLILTLLLEWNVVECAASRQHRLWRHQHSAHARATGPAARRRAGAHHRILCRSLLQRTPHAFHSLPPRIPYAFHKQLPELVGKGKLVFNLSVVADIMLGTVDNWNHSAIRELNPDLAEYLPCEPIIVITPTTSPTVMLLFTQALSEASESFRKIVRHFFIPSPFFLFSALIFNGNVKVGVGTSVRLPVDGLGRNINASDPSTTIFNNTYSMGIWLPEQMRLLRTMGVGDLINPAGNRVSSTYETLLSAIDDFSQQPNVTNFILGPGPNSWPIATYHQFMIRRSSMVDCVKATALIDWIYWSQTSDEARDLAIKYLLFLNLFYFMYLICINLYLITETMLGWPDTRRPCGRGCWTSSPTSRATASRPVRTTPASPTAPSAPTAARAPPPARASARPDSRATSARASACRRAGAGWTRGRSWPRPSRASSRPWCC
jgi:hypothetical protein